MKYRIGDYFSFQNGYAFKSNDFCSMQSGTVVIKIKEFKDNRIDFDSGSARIMNPAPYLQQYGVKDGDILFALTGDPISRNNPNSWVGRVARYEKNYFALLNQRTCKAIQIKDGLEPDYLYYFFCNRDNLLKLAAKATGSASQANISTKTIENTVIDAPNYEQQRRIVNLLNSLNAKISCNKRINDNLAKQAMSIYQQILDANSLSKCHLCDIATITMGQSPAGSSYNEDGIGTVFYQGRTDFGFRFPTRRLYTTEPKKMAAKNDILLSVRAPVGDINVANEPCCIGRGLSSLRSLHNTPSFLYYTMVSLRPQLDQFNGEGTVFGSVSQDSLNNLPIYIPPVDQITSFEATVAPLDAMIMNNNEEIMRLTELRDYLLPRLLNGQISIEG